MKKLISKLSLCMVIIMLLSVIPVYGISKYELLNVTRDNRIKYYFNGQKIEFRYHLPSLPTEIYKNHLYIPYKDFADTFRLKYSYNSETNTIDISNPYSVTELDLSILQYYPNFKNAVYTKPDKHSGYTVFVNKNLLPDSMKNFTNISVIGMYNNSINAVAAELLLNVSEKKVIQKYNENEGVHPYISPYSYPYELVVLYDDNNNLLGYSFYDPGVKLRNPEIYVVQNITERKSNINLTVNGLKFEPKTDSNEPLYPFGFEDDLFLPAKELAEAFGFKFNYDSKTNSVYLVKPNTITDNKSAMSNFLASIKNIDTAVSVPRYKLSSHQIDIDRNKLPDDAKNFKKILVRGIDSNSGDIVSAVLFQQIAQKGYALYSDWYVSLSKNGNQYEVVTLLDENNIIIGYSVLTLYQDKKSLDTHLVKDITVNNPQYISAKYSNFKYFSKGISLSGDVPYAYKIKVNRNELPEEMKNFGRICVETTDVISPEGYVGYHLISSYYDKPGERTFVTVNNTSNNCPITYNIISLHDKDYTKTLGYTIIKVD